MNIKKIIFIILIIMLVIGAVLAVKKKKSQEAAMPTAKAYKINVDTSILQKQRVVLTLPYLSTVESSEDAKISTKLSGRVVKILKIADIVKKGDIVAEIDNNELKSKIEALKLTINSIKLNLAAKKLTLNNLLLTHRRTKELLDVKGASIEEYQNEEDKIALTKAAVQTYKSNIKINQSKIDELENTLTYATLRSPIDGIVSKVFINEGEVAMPGHPLISLSSKSGKYLLVNLPTSVTSKEIIYDKKIYKLTPLNSSFNGLNQYKADIQTLENVGNRVNIKVVVYDDEALKVPLDGIFQNGEKSYIFLVEKDGIKQTEVNIISSGEEGFVISSDFEGKKIVLAKPDIFLKLISGINIKE